MLRSAPHIRRVLEGVAGQIPHLNGAGGRQTVYYPAQKGPFPSGYSVFFVLTNETSPYTKSLTMPESPAKAAGTVVNADIRIAGKPILDTVQIIAIQVHRTLGRVPTAEVGVYLPFEAEEAKMFALSSSDLLRPGQEIELRAGYDNENQTIFKGIITGQSIRTLEGKGIVLTVYCSDKAEALMQDRQTVSYHDIKDSALISNHILEHGLQSDVEATTTTHDQLVQYNSTDWDFILRRAAANGLLLYAEDGKVYAQKPATGSAPVLQIDFSLDVLDFDLETTAPPSAAVPDKIPAGRLRLRQKSPTQVRPVAAPLHGHLSFLGHAGPRVNSRIRLTGFGDRYNGDALVSGVQHRIEAGEWRTAVTLGLPDLQQQDDPATAHLAGFQQRNLQIGYDPAYQALTIRTPAGNTIVLSDRSEVITLHDVTGNKIEMTTDGITL
ncbi:MAG: phage late control D family protein, partial [Bacteroidetes bacterium]